MKALWAIILALFLTPFCYAQEHQPDSISLKMALDSIAERCEVKFSYADKNIVNKSVLITEAEKASLDELLVILEAQTHIKFEKIDDQHIVARPYEAQDRMTICGFVNDKGGKPVRGIVVMVSDSTGAITDKRGFFQIRDVPYSNTIVFKHLAFVTKKQKASDFLKTECSSIKMIETVAFLEELVIRDYLTVGIAKKKKDIEILPQELKILPGLIEPDILQSIQQSPGVISPYETASGIHVRGGSPDQNLVLWNGIKTYNQGHFFGMLSAFNPYITKEVTFIKNGTSAKYGDRVSGVIDIKTDDEVANRISGGAGFNMLYGDGLLSIPIVKDKLSIQVSGRRAYTDTFKTFTFDQFSERVFQNTKIGKPNSTNIEKKSNQFFFTDYTSNIIFKPSEKDKISVNTLYAKNELSFSSLNREDALTFKDFLRTENEGYNIAWNRKQSDQFSFSADAYYALYLLDYNFSSIKEDTTEIASKKNLVRDYGFNVNSSFKLNDNSILNSGYQVSINSIQYAFGNETPAYSLVLDKDDGKVVTHSVYAELELDKDKTFLSAGVRANHYMNLSKTFIEPRLYFQYNPIEILQLNTSAEYRTQVASQIKESIVSDLSLENQVWTLASKDRFPVIDTYQVTTGFSFSKNLWYIDVDTYHKKINGITSLTFGFLNPIDNEYRNGHSTIWGTDVFVKKKIGAYKAWLGYSYINTKNKFSELNDGRSFPGNWNIEHSIKWSHFYEWNAFQVSLGWLWHTGKSYTDLIEVSSGQGPISVQFDQINESKLPLYHRLDFSILYEIRSKKYHNIRYRMGLSVLNIYNRKNLLNREFRTTPSLENELIDTRIFSLGITPNLMFRFFW
ncbi:MAG: TonB-dependent receptor plug domain-containing protein [Cyclobacteriaceae bacterium]